MSSTWHHRDVVSVICIQVLRDAAPDGCVEIRNRCRTEIVFRIGEKVRGNSMSFEILVRHRYWQTRGCLQSPGPEINTCLSWNVNGYHIPVGSERQIVRHRSKIHREITFFQAQRVWITLCTEIRNMPRWTDLLLHLISFQEDSINKQDALQLC